MKGFALLAALALLAPGVRAEEHAGEYPEDMLALLPRWTQEVEALANETDRGRPWWPDAQVYLTKASEAREDGRFRVAMFHLETFSELVVSQKIHDEANATLGSDAERRAFVVARTSAMRADAERAWTAFRVTLTGYDDELRSLHTIEKTLYAADVALVGMLGTNVFDTHARDLSGQSGLPIGYTYVLVRASHTARLNIDWAADILAEAVKQEGLPPRALDEKWESLKLAGMVAPERQPQLPAYLENIDRLVKPVRENNETLLTLAFAFAEQRTLRVAGMQTMFGDGQSRGLDALGDAARGLGRQRNNTTMETPRLFGLTGIFTADAMDRADLTLDYHREGRADLGIVLSAWGGIDHQNLVTGALGAVSPVVPPTQPPLKDETPGAGVALVVLAAACAVALAARRRA